MTTRLVLFVLALAAQVPSGIVAPTVVRRVEPEYSRDAFRQRIEGVASVEAVVLADGSVGDLRVTKSVEPGLDQEAMRAVRQWRFVPGQNNGRPAPATVRLDLAFRLPPRVPLVGEPPSRLSEAEFRLGAADPRVPGFVAPRATYELHPSYTYDAPMQKLQGDVALQVFVQADGSIARVRLVRSVDPTYGLDQQAVNAVRQWRFAPAMVNGAPVAAVTDVVISFRLH